MTSKLSSLLPRDEVLRRNLVTFQNDNFTDNSDSISLKSCPAFRPSLSMRNNRIMSGRRPRYASSSSLSDIREGQPLLSELSTHKKPPDKDLDERVKSLIEIEWKRRIRRKPLNFSALQTLIRKQREEELKYQVRDNSSAKAESDTVLRKRSSQLSKNDTSVKCLSKERHSHADVAHDAPANAESYQKRDPSSLQSKSCTVFSKKQAAQANHQSSSAKASRSVHDDVLEPAHVACTPALGVQELKRRFSMRAKNSNSLEENAAKDNCKLTQTSFTDAGVQAGTHSVGIAEHNKAHSHGLAETIHRSWNTRVTEIEIRGIAEVLPQEGIADPIRPPTTTSSGTNTADNESIAREELRSMLTSYFEHNRQCPEMSDILPVDIILPPPEFDNESPYAHPHQPDSDDETADGFDAEAPVAAGRQEPTAADDPEPVSDRSPRQRRPASAKSPSRATRSRCTQTAVRRRSGRRRSRRVTYSPSEGSGPSDWSEEDHWSARSDRGTRSGRQQQRERRERRLSRQRRPAARDATRWEEAPVRSGGSRPISGRSSQAVGSRPVSGRSHAAGGCANRPTLLEEVHRKARDQRKTVAVKRRRSKRKVYQVPRNMPEAISRFLEQLSRDKEAIRVIHKMSMVTTKK